MNDEFQEMEASLAVLKPVALDPALTARLLACTAGQSTTLDRQELRFEEEMRAQRPTPLSPETVSRLLGAVADTAFPVDEKILLFPKPTAVPAPARRRPPMVAAAAAVALCGAAAALWFPATPPAAPLADSPPTATQARSGLRAAVPPQVLPASFDRGLRSTSDEGVVWHSRDGSHRVLRIEYFDRVTVTSQDGKTVEIEQPRVQYLIVPERID